MFRSPLSLERVRLGERDYCSLLCNVAREKLPFTNTHTTKIFSIPKPTALTFNDYYSRFTSILSIHTYKMKTTWKDIQPVPTSQEFLDVVLSRTQRRLPTQIRAGFKISRIRGFYTRKVKFTQETFTEKLSAILDGFPRLQDIHPFREYY